MTVRDDDRGDLHRAERLSVHGDGRLGGRRPREVLRALETCRDEPRSLGESGRDPARTARLGSDDHRRVRGDLPERGLVDTDDRRPARHRLDDGEPEPLEPRRPG